MVRSRWIAAGVVVVAACAVGVVIAKQSATTEVSVALVLRTEQSDWERTAPSDAEPNGCVGINGAKSVRAGAKVVFTDGDGANLDEHVLPGASWGTATDGIHCYVNYTVELPSNRDAYVLSVDGLPAGNFTPRQLEAANAPDVYPGLAVYVSACTTTCVVETRP